MDGSDGAKSTRYLIVVARDEVDLFEYLRQRFRSDKKVEVILDRRRADRRQQSQTRQPERRSDERRQDRFRSGGLVLIRKRQDHARR